MEHMNDPSRTTPSPAGHPMLEHHRMIHAQLLEAKELFDATGDPGSIMRFNDIYALYDIMNKGMVARYIYYSQGGQTQEGVEWLKDMLTKHDYLRVCDKALSLIDRDKPLGRILYTNYLFYKGIIYVAYCLDKGTEAAAQWATRGCQ